MSITAYKAEAVGHDRTGKDFSYANLRCIVYWFLLQALVPRSGSAPVRPLC